MRQWGSGLLDCYGPLRGPLVTTPTPAASRTFSVTDETVNPAAERGLLQWLGSDFYALARAPAALASWTRTFTRALTAAGVGDAPSHALHARALPLGPTTVQWKPADVGLHAEVNAEVNARCAVRVRIGLG